MPNAHDVLFRTLADPTRRALFERLCREGEKTVAALTARRLDPGLPVMKGQLP